MTDYKATYSPDDNKLRLSGVPKELYARVKAAGFRWAPMQKICIAPTWSPEAEDIAIELAGEIGDEDSSLLERAEVRAERFEDYSDKRAEDAERAFESLTSVGSGPVVVGHHDSRRAQREADRIESGMKKTVNLWETSKYWTQRARGAIRHAKYKELPGVRARRIKTLEAKQRKHQRTREQYASLLEVYTHPKWEGKTTKDGRTYRGAMLSTFEGGISFEDRQSLAAGTLPYDDAIGRAVAKCNANITDDERWISHLENRLTYEKVMLEDQGESDLIAPKPKRELLPLCNYRAPEGLQAPDMYQRGQMETYQQVEMTSAEYAKVRAEQRGTRIVDRSHRVRIALIQRPGQAYFVTDQRCVFLTDSKVHKRPVAAPAAPLPAPRMFETRAYTPPERTKFDALKESLAHGVKAVTAPQLFPTPADLAARMVAEADIRTGHSVLEPSAGTGALLKAINEVASRDSSVRVTAVEIREDFKHLANMAQRVHFGDFLRCNGELGKFDRILMNPPFAEGQDIEHVEHALHMLKPGGRLVAIMSAGILFRQGAAARFRALVDERGGTIEKLPANSFMESGTGTMTVLVTLDA